MYKEYWNYSREHSENGNSIINILFNVNFNLSEAVILDKDFLKKLNKNYRNLDETIQKKVIVIIVAATANEANHKRIIENGFYTVFKMNLNAQQNQPTSAHEEIELFGLINIAINKKNLSMIHADLRRIHKKALLNKKVDFKTRVDLFEQCSQFLHDQCQSKESTIGKANDKSQDIINNTIKALLLTLVQLIKDLDRTNYLHFKYLLNAIL